jgi:hypothetical protein
MKTKKILIEKFIEPTDKINTITQKKRLLESLNFNQLEFLLRIHLLVISK